MNKNEMYSIEKATKIHKHYLCKIYWFEILKD